MPTREGLLRDHTFKEDGLETGKRVFYTLESDKSLQLVRTSKLVALLTEHLEASGKLSAGDVDELLLNTVR